MLPSHKKTLTCQCIKGNTQSYNYLSTRTKKIFIGVVRWSHPVCTGLMLAHVIVHNIYKAGPEQNIFMWRLSWPLPSDCMIFHIPYTTIIILWVRRRTTIYSYKTCYDEINFRKYQDFLFKTLWDFGLMK